MIVGMTDTQNTGRGSEPLVRAIKLVTLAKLARELSIALDKKVSLQFLRFMAYKKQGPIDAAIAKAVHKITKGKVKKSEIRPDIFGA